jgi:hypothetical protein
MTRAPAFMHSRIAAASSSGPAPGSSAFAEKVSAKTGRTSRVQSGQMAGAAEERLAHNMPATNVASLAFLGSRRRYLN